MYLNIKYFYLVTANKDDEKYVYHGSRVTRKNICKDTTQNLINRSLD